jgi:5-methylcytosine-specific restriction endonuclease McrA
VEKMEFIEINGKQFYIGKLCTKNHEYQDSGKSLRYKPFKNRRCGPCVECHREQSRKRGDYYKERYQLKKPQILDNVKKWRNNNFDKVKINQAKYMKSEKGKITCSNSSRRRRSKKSKNHIAFYSQSDILEVKKNFCNKCAYCESQIKLTIDHFIPVSVGGPDCISNFVLSCFKCNRNKSDKDPMTWYKSQDFYSPTQWKKILKILGKTELNYTQIPVF